MLAIVDARAPHSALESLRDEFETILFNTSEQTYVEVAGHPDIFMFQHERTIIAASNTPKSVLDAIRRSRSELIVSSLMVGKQLIDSTFFNCCVTESYWMHKPAYSAPEVTEFCRSKTFIALPQAYARCSTIAISDSCIISSDMGVCKALIRVGIQPLYVDPNEITLPGFRYGFIGGTCGRVGEKLYFLGNIRAHGWGAVLDSYLSRHGIEPICLCNSKLYDGGGIFFV